MNEAKGGYEKACYMQVLNISSVWPEVCEWRHNGRLGQRAIRDPQSRMVFFIYKKYEFNSLGSGKAIKMLKQENNKMTGTVDYFLFKKKTLHFSKEG